MKKAGKIILGVIGVLVLIGILANLGDKNKDSKDDSSKKSIVGTTASTDDSSKSKDESAPEKEEKEEQQVTEATPESELRIENQVLWESEGVTITATGVETDGLFGDEVKLLVENNSEKNIMVGCDALIVNDFMINDLFATSVAAGKKSNESLRLYSTELKTAGIDQIGKIEVYFHITDNDSYQTISESDCITINTSGSEGADMSADVDGFELYNDNGVKILGKYVDEDKIWGTAIMLYIENTSDKKVSIHCDNVSVNGFMMTGLFAQTVYPGKKAYSDITLLKSELEENSIDKIETVELNFRASDSDTYQTIFESGPVSFTVE